MAVVNPAQQTNRHHHRQQHHTSYEKELIHHDVDRRRSLQALSGGMSCDTVMFTRKSSENACVLLSAVATQCDKVRWAPRESKRQCRRMKQKHSEQKHVGRRVCVKRRLNRGEHTHKHTDPLTALYFLSRLSVYLTITSWYSSFSKEKKRGGGVKNWTDTRSLFVLVSSTFACFTSLPPPPAWLSRKYTVRMQSIREPRNVDLIRTTKFMRSVSHGRASTWRRNRVRPDNEISASSLYQMTNGGGAVSNGRSQFSPSELSVNTQVHNHVGSRVRVASVNQLCDSSSTPQFSIEWVFFRNFQKTIF